VFRGSCDCTMAFVQGVPSHHELLQSSSAPIHIYSPSQASLVVYLSTKWSLEYFDGIFMRTLNYFVIVVVMLHRMLKALPTKGCWTLVVLIAATAKKKLISFLSYLCH